MENGDKVNQGDVLGLCGNSGNSSESHIHFQIGDFPNLEEGKSIRIQLENNETPIAEILSNLLNQNKTLPI
ncbi:M23 family metallopeptidase [Alkalihalobacillus sp. TS-13]|uniref:M23 family metallopeptidase n=1 Tax=Alkalihalobacillus sp. TS-13 TaxID=2842455 RepID=UPI002892D8A4|nr:M23 family metallopeptidase [Alkalihalobacillus sp. TS-13]